MESDPQRVVALMDQLAALDRAGAADAWRRTELMDELQDAVGLGGKMVTDRDILRKAGAVLNGT